MRTHHVAVLVTVTTTLANALSARTWLAGSAGVSPFITGGVIPRSEPLELGLLPFKVLHTYLPGEQHTIYVEDEGLLQDLRSEHGCFGQLLVGPGGEVSTITTLLEVDECQPNKAGSVSLRCVGRVRVLDLVQPSEGSGSSSLTASVELFADDAADSEWSEMSATLTEAEEAEPLSEAARAAARAVAASADAAGVSEAAVLEAAQNLLSNLIEEIHRSHGEVRRLRLALEEPTVPSLHDQIASRRALLLGDGPASLQEKYGALWNTGSEADAERQLLSFAALADEPTVRTPALFSQSTTERLTMALCALRETERRLAAQLALRNLGTADE